MANNNVRFFKVAELKTYLDLQPKDANSLYWVDETKSLYLADKLYGTGQIATEEFDGLLSKEDYKELQKLIAGGTVDLEPINERLTAVEGSLTTVTSTLTEVDGRLDLVEKDIVDIKQSITGGIRYMGAVATYADLPVDAKQGHLYEVSSDGSEWCFNGNEWFEYGTSHFVPVAGTGIVVDGATIGVKIATESHGLTVVDGGMTMLLATAEQDGAMSKEDKAALDALVALGIADNFATKDEVQAVADTVASVSESFAWGEL